MQTRVRTVMIAGLVGTLAATAACKKQQPPPPPPEKKAAQTATEPPAGPPSEAVDPSQPWGPTKPVPPEVHIDPLASSPTVDELFGIKPGSPGKGSAVRRATDLAGKLRGAVKAAGGTLVKPGWRVPVAPRAAAQLARAIVDKNVGGVSSLEAAVLLTAASARAGLRVKLGEAHKLAGAGGKKRKGATEPAAFADPTGDTGYFAVAVWESATPGAAPPEPTFVDPFGRTIVEAEEIESGRVQAYMLATAARGAFTDKGYRARDQTRALMQAAQPFVGAPKPATFLALEADVAASIGWPVRGVASARLALAAREDAPRHGALARACRRRGDYECFNQESTIALETDEVVPALLLLLRPTGMPGGQGNTQDGLLARAAQIAPGHPAVLRARFASGLRAYVQSHRPAQPRRPPPTPPLPPAPTDGKAVPLPVKKQPPAMPASPRLKLPLSVLEPLVAAAKADPDDLNTLQSTVQNLRANGHEAEADRLIATVARLVRGAGKSPVAELKARLAAKMTGPRNVKGAPPPPPGSPPVPPVVRAPRLAPPNMIVPGNGGPSRPAPPPPAGPSKASP